MLVHKINLTSNLALKNQTNMKSNSNNRALSYSNATDTITFSAINRSIPKEIRNQANIILKKYRELEAPIIEAEKITSKTRATDEEIEAAEKIIANGIKMEAPVEIAGEKQLCKVEIGNYMSGNELELQVGEGENARNYRLKLAGKNKDKVSLSSKLKISKFGKEGCFSETIPLNTQEEFDNTLTIVKTLLNAFGN